MLERFKPHIAIFLANALYGANYTIAKTVMPEFMKPFAFIFMRVSGALAIFIMLQFFVAREKIAPKDFIRLFFCGVFGVAINQLMFFKGLNLTVPINASLIMITTPIIVMTFSAIFLNEKLAWYKILGLILGLTGAFFIVGGTNMNFSSETATGDLFVFINAVSYAVYLILVKPLMLKYKPLTVMKWVFMFGFIPVFLFSFREFQAVNFDAFTTNTWLSVVFVVFGVTVGAYLLNIYALSKVNPSVVGVYIYLQPILAIFFAWLLVNEVNLTLEKGLAGSLIFVGVYLVSFGKRHFEKKLTKSIKQ
ncbi:MAG: DMT family transporter [Chitinophagales bacterium]